MNAAIVATIAISAHIVVLGILSFQTATAQSSFESDSYARGAGIGSYVGYVNGYANYPYLDVDPNQYCNGDADCIAGFVSSSGAGYIAGKQAATATPPSLLPHESFPEGCAKSIIFCD